MRAAILRHTLRAMRSQWWPARRIEVWQERALVRTMRHAVTAVPFYRDLRILPESVNRAEDLQRFPIIVKRDLQRTPERFLAEGFDRRALHSSRTSGSTGEPTTTWFDRDAWALGKYALKIRRTLAVTSPWFHRCLIVSEQPASGAARYENERPFKSGWLYAERVVSLFDELDMHRRAIREFRPDMLYAFPSYLLELKQAYERAGERLPRIPLLFTSSEVLTEAARSAIEAAFGGRVFDIYGSTEFKEVAWQCEAGTYHLNFESVHAEVSPVSGTWLLTSLANRAMPLLRFDTQDLGSLETSTACACGRESPQLRIASGREGEVMQLPSGRRLSPYLLTTIVETLPGVYQYRILHEQPSQLDIEIVAPHALSREVLEECRARLLEVLREALDVTLRRVESLERGVGGKHKVFVRRS